MCTCDFRGIRRLETAGIGKSLAGVLENMRGGSWWERGTVRVESESREARGLVGQKMAVSQVRVRCEAPGAL